jgi:hypothetical protein
MTHSSRLVLAAMRSRPALPQSFTLGKITVEPDLRTDQRRLFRQFFLPALELPIPRNRRSDSSHNYESWSSDALLPILFYWVRRL